MLSSEFETAKISEFRYFSVTFVDLVVEGLIITELGGSLLEGCIVAVSTSSFVYIALWSKCTDLF